MPDYQKIAASLWNEPEYKTETHQNVAAYLIANRDMAGVVPVHERSTASKLRISSKKLRSTLDYFESIDKLIIGRNRTHVWWKSGIYHSLYKGNFSEKQLKNVQKLLAKWEFSGVFRADSRVNEQNFIKLVTQLYESKYNLVIPIISPLLSYPNTNTNTNTNPNLNQSGANVDNSQTNEPEQPPEPPTEETGRTDLFNKTDKEKEQTDGPDNKNGYQILESEYQSARDYFKKRFGKEIVDEEIDRLVHGDSKIKFQGMGNVQTLVFAIANYKSKIKPADPIGLLIDVGKNPEKYFQDDMLKSYHQQGVKPVFSGLKLKNVDHS